jgi:phospholipid transport system substrate-binding protein
MRTRYRLILNLLLVAPALMLLGASVPAPMDQLRMDVARVLTVLQDSRKAEGLATERQVALRKIVSEIVDFEETGRRALGRHWAPRTPGERAEFIGLFRRLLEETYLAKLKLYGEETITYVGESVDGGEAIVRARIVPKQGAEVPVDYRMYFRGDRWRVYDVVMDGVSLVDNYRTQFNRIIQTSSYAELIAKLQARDGNSEATRAGRSR